MLRRLVTGLMAVGVCAVLAGPAQADNRISASKKGSLLIYSKVELKWECRVATEGPECFLTQDTILDLSNDYPEDVSVQFYFVNGDPPTPELCDISCPRNPDGSCPQNECLLEREHSGWNWVDCEIPLTPNQPTYMHLFTGQPAGCQPFTSLDPGDPPGRPDPENPRTGRVLRGFVYAWAVKNNPGVGQNVQIRWNHLVGDALIINYLNATAAEYNAYAAAVVASVPNGGFVGTPGILKLNGLEYDIAFERMVMDFYATITFVDLFPPFFFGALSGDERIVINDTDITVHPVSADLRQQTGGPVRTKVVYDIWNEDERRRSGTEICVTCWNQTIASMYPAPNHLLIGNLSTAKGKARLEGCPPATCGPNVAGCPGSINAAILGVQIKVLDFYSVHGPPNPFMLEGKAESAITMVGQGDLAAEIKYDILEDSDEVQGFESGNGIGPGRSLKNTGKTGR
jgi:hypothetical protein